MHDTPTFRTIARRLGLTLLCVLMIVMAMHMLIEPAGYTAAGGHGELRGSGGGNAGSAIRVILRQSVAVIGTGGTAAALMLGSVAGLGLLWRPRAAASR
jgi:hypothetical protein